MYNPRRTRLELIILNILLIIFVFIGFICMPYLWYIEIGIWLCAFIPSIKMYNQVKKDEASMVFQKAFSDYNWHRMEENKTRNSEPGMVSVDEILVARIPDKNFSHLLKYQKTTFIRREGEREEDWDIAKIVEKTIGLKEYRKLRPYKRK